LTRLLFALANEAALPLPRPAQKSFFIIYRGAGPLVLPREAGKKNKKHFRPAASDSEAARPPALVFRELAKINAKRAKLAIKVRALHADALRELTNLAVAQYQLLLQISPLEMLARLA
jgi:hypothetical protein